jgi:glycosyltransferase involved in cell wall biosynthesis
MKTAFLSTALPNADSGSGASIVLEVLARTLRDRGHDVAICAVVYPEYVTPDGAGWERQLERARSLGFEVDPVVSEAWKPRDVSRDLSSRLRRAVRPAPEELYPTMRDASSVGAAVERLGPDAVFVYGFEALAASAEIRAPRFAATSDPPQLALRERTRRRWRERKRPLGIPREAVALQAAVGTYERLTFELLRSCAAVGAFGHHHAEWLRTHGFDCGYYRTPIADESPLPGDDSPRHAPLRILLVGHLHGTATLDGLRVFERMLPVLRRELGPDGFRTRLVGGYDAPAEVRPLLSQPEVELAGFVDDVGGEFRAADVLLVPVSIPLGVRVRILTGFSHGSCIVAHVANAAGIPELRHDENALLGRDANELARQIALVAANADLRQRLRAGARATYERFFTPAATGGALAETLERISSPHRS